MNDLPVVNTLYNGKIDKRRKYYIVLDTETGNGIKEGKKLNLDYSLVYDCGFAVVDKTGKVYEMYSFINYDIFFRNVRYYENLLLCGKATSVF